MDLQRILTALRNALASRPRSDERCPACNGNDADIPCAYPGENYAGCLRDKRRREEGAP